MQIRRRCPNVRARLRASPPSLQFWDAGHVLGNCGCGCAHKVSGRALNFASGAAHRASAAVEVSPWTSATTPLQAVGATPQCFAMCRRAYHTWYSSEQTVVETLILLLESEHTQLQVGQRSSGAWRVRGERCGQDGRGGARRARSRRRRGAGCQGPRGCRCAQRAGAPATAEQSMASWAVSGKLESGVLPLRTACRRASCCRHPWALGAGLGFRV